MRKVNRRRKYPLKENDPRCSTCGCVDCRSLSLNNVCSCKDYISTDSLYNFLTADNNITLVDVSPIEVYDDCHIEGAENIPLKELDTIAAEWGKEQFVVVYGTGGPSCQQAEQALKILKDLAITRVSAYRGGLTEWRKEELPTEGPCINVPKIEQIPEVCWACSQVKPKKD